MTAIAMLNEQARRREAPQQRGIDPDELVRQARG